jgi:hypothetical protein
MQTQTERGVKNKTWRKETEKSETIEKWYLFQIDRQPELSWELPYEAVPHSHHEEAVGPSWVISTPRIKARTQRHEEVQGCHWAQGERITMCRGRAATGSPPLEGCGSRWCGAGAEA